MNETLIQSAYFDSLQPPIINITIAVEDLPSAPKISRMTKLSKIFACIGASILIVYTMPKIVHAIVPTQTDWVMKQEDTTFMQNSGKNLSYQPGFDSSLPLGAHLIIPKIKVNTPLEEASYENHEEALEKGVWRVDNFGTPDKREKPTILAAHRFGYLKWTNLYRREHSFYNLPKLDNGDVVNIVWGQRKYTYEIYAQSSGTEIVDYNADLILYTCEDLNSDVKIFRYARLLTI